MIRNIGIFFLCLSIMGILSITGLIAYRLWDENRAEKSAALTSQLIYEQIEQNNENSKETAAQLNEIYLPSEEIISESGEANLQLVETVLTTSETILHLDKLVMRLNEVISELDNEINLQLLEINGESYIGILSIPSLSLKLPINNEWSYDRLKESSCRYAGNITSSLVICAHDYKNHFGRIPNLSQGDIVLITDAKGEEHQYQVELVITLDGTDIDTMINSPYDLTLFTCLASDDTKRIAVRCNKARLTDHLTEESVVVGELTGPQSEAPNYKIDYKKEIIKLKKGDLYSLDSGINFTEVIHRNGLSLDVSDSITNGVDIQIKKPAASKKPASKIQIITPAARLVLEDLTLSCKNGKVTLDTKKYEVYNPKTKTWGGVPKVTADAEFYIRLKSNIKESKNGITGNAASNMGNLIITYGVYDTEKNKSGIIFAEIITHGK